MTTYYPSNDLPKYVVRLEHIYVTTLRDISIEDLKYIYVEDLMNKKKRAVKKLKLNKKTNFKVLDALLNKLKGIVCWVEFEYQMDDLNYLIPICKKVDSDSELQLCVKVKVKNPTLEDILESEDFVPTDKMLIAIKQRYKELFDTDTDLIYNGPIINSTTPKESSQPLSKSNNQYTFYV